MANCRLLFRCVGSGTDQQSHRCFVAERQHTGRWFVTLGLGGPDVSDGSFATDVADLACRLMSASLRKRPNLMRQGNDALCHLRKSFDHPTAYAANSSSSALASFRSRVSKPSVNHPYTGASSSRASCTLL